MKNLKIYSIGQSVEWTDKNGNGNGTVRDDLGQTTVMINVLELNGEKCTKIRLIKRELLNIKKENKMEKSDVKKLLLQGKYKKWSKVQLLDKVKKIEEGDEKDVIVDLLKVRGVTIEEIGLDKKEEKVIEVENEEVVKTEPDKVKASSKKVGNSHVVEFEDEEPIIEVKVEKIKKVKEIKDKSITHKSSKETPAEGSKSAEILAYLKANPEEKISAVAKHFGTYYSVVDRVIKVYMK